MLTPHPSPWMTSLIIIGIVTCAAAPPLGMIFLALAALPQSRHRRRRKAALREAQEKAVRAAERRRAEGLRYFAS